MAGTGTLPVTLWPTHRIRETCKFYVKVVFSEETYCSQTGKSSYVVAYWGIGVWVWRAVVSLDPGGWDEWVLSEGNEKW